MATSNRCDECDREWTSHESYRQHMRDKHGVKIPREPDPDEDRLTEADYQT